MISSDLHARRSRKEISLLQNTDPAHIFLTVFMMPGMVQSLCGSFQQCGGVKRLGQNLVAAAANINVSQSNNELCFRPALFSIFIPTVSDTKIFYERASMG